MEKVREALIAEGPVNYVGAALAFADTRSSEQADRSS